MNFESRILSFILAFSFVLIPFSLVLADDYSVTPFLIDRVAEPRETISETVLLKNDGEYTKYIVYATVNEISVGTEGEIKQFVSPVMTDRSNTVTSWIEVTRGRIEVPAGTQKEVPLTIRINPFAEPGEYHAFVGFVPAKNRPKAEAVAMAGDAEGVIIKITIADKRQDSMKISGFLINRFITDDSKREVDVIIENTGDIASAPVGEIIFYDSRGIEIDSTPFNTEETQIPPGETVILKGVVPISDDLGRYKANISLKYGDNQRAALFDTTSFYLMPIHLLLAIFGGILLITILLALLFRRSFTSTREEDEYGDEVAMYIKDGHEANPQDHDINLKNTTEK